ncbi:MAG: leucine-rich repeat domain-containing protein, partial [Pirellulaceae bacterium]
MRISLVVLLLLLALGCGGATQEKEPTSGAADYVEDAYTTDESSGSAAGVGAAPVTPEEMENRQDFIGNWGEIDANEQIRFSESGTVSISGGEMAFRGRYRVTEKGIAKLSLDGLGELFGTVTGTLSASGDELVVIAEVAPDEPSSYRRKESPPTSGKPEDLRNSPQATAAIDAAIRKSLDKETGEITEADLAKVTRLDLANKDIVDLAPLAGMSELEFLNLNGNWIID